VVRDLPDEALSDKIRRLPRGETRRAQIMEAMTENLDDPLGVRGTAAKLGISARHLNGLCRSLFGVPPSLLFLKLRLRKAEEMLRYEGLRVNEVSDRLGFSNPYHFSRAFRRVYGVPPSRLL